MKSAALLFLAMVGAIGPRCGASSSAPVAGVAVVELFTSEGCSSCPPAERVLGELAGEAARDGRPVLTLAFHVDYWNRLGWADRFSDPAFSRRQERYAKTLNLSDLYTPQMVVNGTAQFVGSDRKAADRAIADALAKAQSALVVLNVNGNKRDGYRVHTTVKGADPGTVVNVAVVEQGLSTDVNSGENRGRRLDEPSVVRWFKSARLPEGKEIVVPSLPEVRAQNASVIVYVQRPENGMVLGASSASLPAQ
jgi:hypothetical protein